MTRLCVVLCAAWLVSGCSGTPAARPGGEAAAVGVADTEAAEAPRHWTRHPVAVPFMKIGRGALNILISPLDIPATVVRVQNEQWNFGYSLVAGTFEGIGNACARFLAGVVEILTFPLVYDAEPFYTRRLGERAVRIPPEPLP